MARIFDVIEYPNEMTDELVHRFPDDGTTRRLPSWLQRHRADRAKRSLLPRWSGNGYVWTWTAYHRNCQHSPADPEIAGHFHQWEGSLSQRKFTSSR